MSTELAGRLQGHVEQLAGSIGERNVWRAHALAAAARYVRSQWEAQGLEVSAQGYRVEGQLCENLEVEFGGEGAGGIVLVGAHYDTVQGSPGANDNASGVAGLIEIARLLRGAAAARTIRLVAFVNEEPPFFYSSTSARWAAGSMRARRAPAVTTSGSCCPWRCSAATAPSRAASLTRRS